MNKDAIMKTLFLSLLLLMFSAQLFSQSIDTIAIQQKADEILEEANRLYRYEKTAWLATDEAMINETIRPEFAAYLIYESGDSMVALILNKERQCIMQLTYPNDFSKEGSRNLKQRNLTAEEQKLLTIKNKIIEQLDKKKYDVGCPQGYNLNAVLIPDGKSYKFYLLTGTSKKNVIPFGNDYLFTANKKGKITSFRKFHSNLIPGMTEFKGYKITELMHSHLKTTPYISATDICTFRLYAPMYKLEAFMVYSPKLKVYFRYSLKDNSVTVVHK